MTRSTVAIALCIDALIECPGLRVIDDIHPRFRRIEVLSLTVRFFSTLPGFSSTLMVSDAMPNVVTKLGIERTAWVCGLVSGILEMQF